MNFKEIKEIIHLMNENDLTEVEIERDGLKVKLSKASLNHTAPASAYPVRVEHVPQVAGFSAESAMPAAQEKKNVTEIKSPMVGTFYRSPSPESDPFVEIGKIVEVGQVVCIIEAMKLMNEIKSEVRGRVIEAALDNAEPVEFGQTLFVVEPA